MNNKIFILFFILFAAISVSVLAESKPQQKDKNKETRGTPAKSERREAKAEQSEAKSAKTSESKEKDKAISVKIDSLKIKLKNVKSELDSLIISDLNLKLKPFKKKAHASYYHDRFNGRRTASGTRFSNNAYTAAHKKLPFGTVVKVTNEANGKSVIVEITDRGPFSKAREIDLSRRAFMDIAANKNSGVVIVTIEEVIQPK